MVVTGCQRFVIHQVMEAVECRGHSGFQQDLRIVEFQRGFPIDDAFVKVWIRVRVRQRFLVNWVVLIDITANRRDGGDEGAKVELHPMAAG